MDVLQGIFFVALVTIFVLAFTPKEPDKKND